MNPFEKALAERRDPPRRVPDSELHIEFARSSGPGGQKVNKTSSKAVLRWHIDSSSAFTPEEKTVLKQKLANRINREGELYLDSDRLRSQHQNRQDVIDLLERLVAAALAPEIERKATQPTRASKERRLEDKRRQAQRKERRRNWQ